VRENSKVTSGVEILSKTEAEVEMEVEVEEGGISLDSRGGGRRIIYFLES